MIPLLLMLQDAPRPAPVRLDLRNWHSSERVESGHRTCRFALSPDFYGIALQYGRAADKIDVSFDSPGVHVLPTGVAIPLKIIVNGDVHYSVGQRTDRILTFRLDRAGAETAFARRGMIRILLAAQGVPETLIARYRLRGKDYEGVAARFQACNRRTSTPMRVTLADGR